MYASGSNGNAGIQIPETLFETMGTTREAKDNVSKTSKVYMSNLTRPSRRTKPSIPLNKQENHDAGSPSPAAFKYKGMITTFLSGTHNAWCHMSDGTTMQIIRQDETTLGNLTLFGSNS